MQLRRGDVQPPQALRLPNRKQRKAAQKTVIVQPQLVASLAVYAMQADLGPEDRFFDFGSRRAQQIVRVAAMRAGVSKLKKRNSERPERCWAWPHLFRHGAGVNLVRQTGRLDIVQDQLGHKDLNTTKLYLRVTSREKEELIRGVEF